MKHFGLSTRLFAAVLGVLFVYVTGTGGEGVATNPESVQTLADAYWGDLSQEDHQDLLKFCLSLPRSSFLEESAGQFMSRKGFKRTEIMGPVTFEGSPKLIALREGKVFALSLSAVEPPMFPGVYWSEGVGSAWSVIQPGGEAVTYWVDKEL